MWKIIKKWLARLFPTPPIKKFMPLDGPNDIDWRFQVKIPDRIVLLNNVANMNVKDGDDVYVNKDADRTEMVLQPELDETIPNNQMLKYQWFLKVDPDFYIDPAINQPWDWLLITQFHHWGKGGPKLGIHLSEDSHGCFLQMQRRDTPAIGSPRDWHGHIPITRGSYHRITIKANWATDSTGYFELKVDGTTHVVFANQPTIYDVGNFGNGRVVTEPHCTLKLGMYRSGKHPNDMKLAYKDITIREM